MTTSLRTIGIDVHKDTYSLAAYNPCDNTYFAEVTIEATTKAVLKYLNQLRKMNGDIEIRIGYEAGPTGFNLKRDLEKEGYDCRIMAPTSIYKEAGGKNVKTDKRDARELSRVLFWNAYKEVVPPTRFNEATRDYIRMRDDYKDEEKRAKQQLLSFLLRKSMNYNGTYWTQKHFTWLRGLKFDIEVDNLTFQEYLSHVQTLMDKITLLDAKIEEFSKDEHYKENVDKLKCFVGIDTHVAMVLVTEIGDFNRFSSATQFASYLGLCPLEHSSGSTERKGGITKAGNGRCRKMLCESANSVARANPSRKSKRLISRQMGMSADVVAYADRGSSRIKKKYFKLVNHGKSNNCAKAACGRELACFIWGMMTGNMEARGELKIQ